MKNDVMGGFRARVVYQMIDLDEMIKMVVLVCLWRRRCDGGGRLRVAVARVRSRGREREREK